MSDGIQLANQAKTLLDNPAFDRAFQNVREALVRGIEKGSGKDVDELILCLRLLGTVKANIVAAVNSGVLDKFNLDQQQRKANRLRSVFGR